MATRRGTIKVTMSVTAPVVSTLSTASVPEIAPNQATKKPRIAVIGSLAYKAWARRQYRRFGPLFRHQHEKTKWIKDARGGYLSLVLEVYACDGECFSSDGELL